MSLLANLLSIPAKAVAQTIGIANDITEKAIGVDLDVLDTESLAQELARFIEEYE